MMTPITEQILAAVMADREYDALTISPDGAVCGWVGRHETTTALYVQDLACDGVPQGKPRILHTGPDLRGYVFLHDGEHVFLLVDQTGDENTRALLVSRDSASASDRTLPHPLTPEGAQCRLIGHKAANPTMVLLGLNLQDPALHDVYALDTSTGEMTLVATNPGYTGWLIDNHANIRGGMRTEDDASVTICLDASPGTDAICPHPAQQWHIPARHASSIAVLGIVPGAGHDALWLLEGCEPDSSTITELRLLPEGACPGQIFTSPAGSEFDGAWLHPGSGIPETLEYGRWTPTYEPMTASASTDLRRLHDALADAALLQPGATVNVDRRDPRSDRLWSLCVDPGTSSPRSLIWDRHSGRIHDLGAQLPERDAFAPVCTTYQEFPTRDKRKIPGYLSIAETSAAAGPGSPPPAVVLVHGGPWDRDRAGFDAETTLLALSGYAVIRVNYRGSAGFGPEHLAAGNKQWGRAMSDDLDDAVNYLAAQGLIDKDRTAIMGSSYGGYAALIAACREGFNYRCAIAAMAPTDLRLLIEQIPSYWMPMRSLLTERIGDVVADAELLDSVSPAQRLEQLRSPLLLAYGEHDPRVPHAHIDLLEAALVSRGIDHELINFTDEGHGLVHLENRLHYYRSALAFLRRHLLTCDKTEGSR